MALREFFRALFSKQPKTAAPSFANAPRAVRPVAPISRATPTGQPALWQSRSADYWRDRTRWVLQQLESDWRASENASAYPDVGELLALLAQEPEAVIRQLPSAARDALLLCDNESLSRSELGDRLGSDPSLVQSLLRQANGVWYGAGLSPVLRVDAAIDRIGLAGTRSVVLASCVDGLLAKPGGAYDGMVASIWSHMVQTGPLARSLASTFGADPEEAFAVALLHDVGKLVLFDRISALRATRRRSVNLPASWLSLAIEHLHEPLGATAAHQWGLGAAAADAIGSHHRRERPALRHPLAEVMFVAERADHARRTGADLDLAGLWALGGLTGDESVARAVLSPHLRAAA